MASPLDIAGVPAPLVIGVTGHRDLRQEDRDELRKRVFEIFHGLKKRYPSTPFVLLSQLAEGADRLVAQVALQPEIGARLIAPLPLPKALYEADFETAASLAEFRDLLGRAERWFEVAPAADETAIAGPGPARDRQYENAGKYIDRQCQLLIALWDGVESQRVGGTAQIIRFQTHGMPDRETCDLNPPQLFPVYHVLTPRVSNPNPLGEPFRLHVIYSPAFAPQRAEEYYSALFSDLDQFNSAVASGGDSLAVEAAQRKDVIAGEFNASVLAPGEALTLNRYAFADALALRLQRRVTVTHWALHALVFVAFVAFVLFAHLPGHPWPALVAAMLFLVAGFFQHRHARRTSLDDKAQDYRAVAEGSRVRFFWQVAGIPESVADHYLGSQRSELDWIRNGLRGWALETIDAVSWNSWSAKERLDFALQHWVAGQFHYFQHAAEQSEKKFERLESLVRLFLGLAVGVGLVTLAMSVRNVSELAWRSCVECDWLDWQVILIDAFLATGALLHSANNRMAHSEHIKRYRRMQSVFGSASESIRNSLLANDLDASRRCLRALGQESLAENGQWVLLHRERPLELPHA